MDGFPEHATKYIKVTKWHVLEKVYKDEEISVGELKAHFNLPNPNLRKKILGLVAQGYLQNRTLMVVSKTNISDHTVLVIGTTAKRWLKHRNAKTFLGEHNKHYVSMCDFSEVASKTYHNKKQLDYV